MSGNSSRDFDAGALLWELREARGITRQDLPREMAKAEIKRDRIPSPKTIYNIEVCGFVPRSITTRFALAEFFGRGVDDIWGSAHRKQRRRVAA